MEWLTDAESSGHPTSAVVNNAGQDMDFIQRNRWDFLHILLTLSSESESVWPLMTKESEYSISHTIGVTAVEMTWLHIDCTTKTEHRLQMTHIYTCLTIW